MCFGELIIYYCSEGWDNKNPLCPYYNAKTGKTKAFKEDWTASQTVHCKDMAALVEASLEYEDADPCSKTKEKGTYRTDDEYEHKCRTCRERWEKEHMGEEKRAAADK